MKKWLLLIIAVLFGFEEYRFGKVKPMIAPNKEALPPIHDLVIPITSDDSAATLTRQIDAISQAVSTKSLQRILIIGPESLAENIKEKLRSYRVNTYRIQTGDGDLRKLVDPLTSMLTFSNARNVLICAPKNVLKPILLRAHEAELDVIAYASGEFLTKDTLSSDVKNWILKWRALIETM